MRNQRTAITGLFLAAMGLVLAACTADPIEELERVAKDWSLTIRASQVIPVYPLSEDIQPGDVFLVPVSISEQTRVYQEKGFLPTSQLLTRLDLLPYDEFYKDSYWKGLYSSAPHPRPTPLNSEAIAPRAAFPSYTFSVDRSEGLQLALPIQGIPFGLGLMGAARATGTVTISDSYTYGIDISHVYESLRNWSQCGTAMRSTLAAMEESSESQIFLRAVTRVYLAKELDVSLANIESRGGGADAGQAHQINLPTLPSDTANGDDVLGAYAGSLDQLSEPFNGDDSGGPFRFTQIDQHTVSMKQTFDRPLVVGFAGFDVKVLPGGNLSAPIPSFTVLASDISPDKFTGPIPFTDDKGLSDAYVEWLLADSGENRDLVVRFLVDKGIDEDVDPADLAYNSAMRCHLLEARREFQF